jgi:hypothetical protein
MQWAKDGEMVGGPGVLEAFGPGGADSGRSPRLHAPAGAVRGACMVGRANFGFPYYGNHHLGSILRSPEHLSLGANGPGSIRSMG